MNGAFLEAAKALGKHLLILVAPFVVLHFANKKLANAAPRHAPPAQLTNPERLDDKDDRLRRLRKCEAIIRRRSSRVVVVLERCTQSHNYSAVLRTAEALGYHHLWLIQPPSLDHNARANLKKKRQWKEDAQELEEHVAFAKKATEWLDIREFATAEECIAALRADGREVWVTDLSQGAVCLTAAPLRLPRRMAIVMGTESTGASATMLAAADKRVYLPLHGWADSLNLSVAAALVLQRLQDVDETVVGDMSDGEREVLRRVWYPRVARNSDELDDVDLASGVEPLDDLRRVASHRKGWLNPSVVRGNEARGAIDGIGFDGPR